MIKLIRGDCLEKMKDIPAGSVDLILTDPPYGTIKGIEAGGWSSMSTGWDVVIDTDKVMQEADRVLRKNGKMALFAQQPFTTELINKAIPNIPYNYSMVWEKDRFGNALSAKKAPVSYYEDILLFSKKHRKYDFEGAHPLRGYFKQIFDFIGLSKNRLIERVGQRADHSFRTNSTQYSLCTEETYSDLITIFSIDSMDDFKGFDWLKAVDVAYREELLERMNSEHLSTFNLWEGGKFKGNILRYKKDYEGFHPTQKPVALLEDLIKTYSNPGDTVLDFTMGSGSTGVACKKTGRSFIGIELDKTYFYTAVDRIKSADKREA